MRRGMLGAAIAALLLWNALPAYPQATVKPCVTVSAGLSGCPPVSASNPLPVSGTVTATASGTLYAICLNSAATATNVTTVYDNPSTSGTVIAVPAATTATVPTCLQYGPAGIAFANGLTVITTIANGGDMTFSFK